jgi:hypothetical protein
MNAPAKEELPSRRASDRIDGFFTRRTDTFGRLIPPDRGAYQPKPSPISTPATAFVLVSSIRAASALPPIADLRRKGRYFRNVPILLQKSVEIDDEP